MSDNIPLEIQQEIMKRLPIKSLLQFRSVSKSWKFLIDNSKFIADYQRTQLPQHVLVRDDNQYNYVSIADNETFPQQKVSLTVPMSIKTLNRIVGSSEGLFCLYSDVYAGIYSGMNKIVIWNPSIRKSVNIDLPNVLDPTKYHTSISFGVRPDTLDPMLVSISWLHTITATT